jgi:hypothetical protein
MLITVYSIRLFAFLISPVEILSNYESSYLT